jgi:hypothetical protein
MNVQMLQNKTNSDHGGNFSLKAENLPLYFYSEKDNKIVKVQKNQSIVFYQIKRYDEGEIMHSYGTKPPRALDEIVKELENFKESTFEKFKSVAASYYQKEIENAALIRKQVFNR